MKRTFTFLLIGFVFNSLQAQLVVNTNLTASTLVNSLVDPSLRVSNVTEDCNKNLLNIARGSFLSLGTNLSINSGILLTTGNATLSIGPNNSPSIGLGSLGIGGGMSVDADLQNIIGPGRLYDLCKVEFDILPTDNTLSISYVFGSEEYPEYAPPIDNSGTFNDVFGFFLSGPGLTGNVNFALLPNGDRVSVNSINAVTNSQYLIDNTLGASIQYDGFTRELTSKIAVTPNVQYHVKLAIADVGDSYYDTGVFFKAGSLSSVPIKLLSFKGIKDGNENIVEWATSLEEGLSYSELQKSTDGRNFKTIEKFMSNRNGKKYNFHDKNPFPGINYYRLKQVDNTGKSTYSRVVEVNNYYTDLEIASVYPIPAKQYLIARLNSPEATEVEGEILNMDGKLVGQEHFHIAKGSNSLNLNTNDLGNGVYFIRFHSDRFTTQMQRFVK